MIAHLLGLACAAALFWLIAMKPRSLGPVSAALFCLGGCRQLEHGSTIGAAVSFFYGAVVLVLFLVFLRPEVNTPR